MRRKNADEPLLLFVVYGGVVEGGLEHLFEGGVGRVPIPAVGHLSDEGHSTNGPFYRFTTFNFF